MICKDSLSFFFSGKQIGIEHVYIYLYLYDKFKGLNVAFDLIGMSRWGWISLLELSGEAPL